MPVNYPMPAWLNRDTGSEYSSGLRAGAEVGMEMRRLAQQERIANQNAALSAQETQARIGLQEAELAMKQQYQQMQMGIQMRQMEQDEALKQAELAERQSVAQMQYGPGMEESTRQIAAQQRYRQLIDSGVSAEDALMQVGPDFGGSLSWMAQLAKQKKDADPLPPPEFKTATWPGAEEGDKPFTRHYVQYGDKISWAPGEGKEGQISMLDRQALSYMEKELAAMQKEHENDMVGARDSASKTPGDAGKAYLARQQQIDALRQQIESSLTTGDISLPGAARPQIPGAALSLGGGTNAVRVLSVKPAATAPVVQPGSTGGGVTYPIPLGF